LNTMYRDAVRAARLHIKKRKLCSACLRVMPLIGYEREGGAPHEDWPERRFHKKCWRRIVEDGDSYGCGSDNE